VIRLLHLADLHLGRAFQMLGEKGAAQRRALEAALVRAVDLAIAEHVHLVLIAGLAGLVAGYAFAWVGHFFFEKNRPATFTHPLYSFMGDWVMWKDILTGKIRF